MKNKILTLIARLTTVAMLVTTVFNFAPAQAATMSAMSDTMSRLQASVVSNHTIAATATGSTNWDVGDTVTVTFGSGFDLTGLANTDPLDYDISLEGADESIVAAGGCASNDAIEITSISGQVITFTACPSFTPPSLTGSLDLIIEIGLNATNGGTGDTQITNPTAGANSVALAGTIGDSGTIGLSIVDSDYVTVTATVSPSITFDIDTYTAANTTAESAATYAVSLGTLASGSVSSSGDTDTDNGIEKIGLDLATNASGGAVVTVQNANGSSGLKSTSVPADTIPSASSTTLAAGTPGYGICVNYVKAGQSDPVGTFRAAGGSAFGGALSATSTTGADGSTTSATCTDTVHTLTTGLDGTAQDILDTSTAPVAAARALVLVKAAISGVTPAHDDYTDTLTFVATGTF